MRINHFIQRFLQQNSFSVQYRDNRYCSEDFKINSKIHKHRPDAELRLTKADSNSNAFYWIELDRGTEYLSGIGYKFEKFSKYLEYLEKENRQLPEAIVFITNEKEHTIGMKRRWFTITEAFFKHLSKWATKINLIYGTLAEIDDILGNEIAHTQIYEKFVKGKLKYYFRNTAYKGSEFIELGYKEQLEWEPALISVTHHDTYHQLFLYERNQRFETRGFARAIAFANYLKEAKMHVQSLRYVRDIVPVFYHNDPTNNVISIPYQTIASHKKINNLHPPIWVNVNEEPIWIDEHGQPIKRNPLIPS